MQFGADLLYGGVKSFQSIIYRKLQALPFAQNVKTTLKNLKNAHKTSPKKVKEDLIKL